MDRETVIRLWRELPGGDIVIGSALQRFADKVEAAEREQHVQWKRELRQMAEDSADRGDAFAQRVLRALDA